ncbi:MAG: TetR/AcrR family transcriptional regulator [Aquificae bacterium]|nr:TetR/AcrR family transcriptional regulator [Aquificota bacterium]
MGEKRSDTKQKILEASLKLFSKKGFKETTVKDIAREVGITEGAIYRHFTSKEEIIRELIESITRELKERLLEAINEAPSGTEALNLLVKHLLDYAFEKPESFRFLNLYHLLKEARVENMPGELIRHYLESLYEKGLLRTRPEIALALITGGAERVFVFKEKGFLKDENERVKEELESVLKELLIRK